MEYLSPTAAAAVACTRVRCVPPDAPSGVTSGSGDDDVLLMMRAISETIGELIRWASAQGPKGLQQSSEAQIDVRKIKNAAASKVGLKRAPKLVDILAALPEAWKKKLAPLLTAKPIRSASGISVVAVMCKPHRCPHIAMTGNICVCQSRLQTCCLAPAAHPCACSLAVFTLAIACLSPDCPGGPDSDFEYSTQAYTGYEPTSMRAIRARYDPYKQTRSRVEQLERLGHQGPNARAHTRTVAARKQGRPAPACVL